MRIFIRPIYEVMKPSRLPDHPVFLRLSPEEGSRLIALGELWEAPQGSLVYHPGDSGEDLLLVLEGRLEWEHSSGTTYQCLPGDLWGEDRLATPRPLEFAVRAVSKTRWLKWSRQTLIGIISTDSSMRKGLSPLRDKTGRLISGLPEAWPQNHGDSPAARRLRPSLRPAIAALAPAGGAAFVLHLAAAAQDALPAVMPFAALAAYLGWFIVFVIKRWMTDYGYDADSLTSRVFDWTNFSIESRHVPMDRVQGVAVEQTGLFRRILGIGTIIVKTSALDGELVFRNVDRFKAIRSDIQSLTESVSLRALGRDRESIRRSLEKTDVSSNAPKLIESAEDLMKTSSRNMNRGDLRFRKSPMVLVGRLLLPISAAAAVAAGAGITASLAAIPTYWIRLAAVLPLLWALYRLEDWRNDSFGIIDGYAVDLYRKPLGLKESRRQVALSSIQNIRTEQNGFLPFLFRYGNVILVTTGGAADTVFENVARPWRIQGALFRRREEDRRRREEMERDSRKDDLIRFAEALDQIHRTEF
ncbi:MAG: PH domain-containing protein [Spirochaetaceae bacterium]|nr:PH domain-containing protein [Spirochaetaceae bacterium]